MPFFSGIGVLSSCAPSPRGSRVIRIGIGKDSIRYSGPRTSQGFSLCSNAAPQQLLDLARDPPARPRPIITRPWDGKGG